MRAPNRVLLVSIVASISGLQVMEKGRGVRDGFFLVGNL